ncbi:MAG: ABC transporter permease [Candidatus Helarchaeota archaeon]
MERISKFKQGINLFLEEIRGAFSTKMYLVFALIFVLPLVLTLISFALEQYPDYLGQISVQNFLNTPYYFIGLSSEGVINTFRNLFAGAMGISAGGMSFRSGTFGFATIFYVNFPMIAVVAMVCMGTIAADREKGVLAIYASKPIYRTEIVLMRYLAFAVISLVLSALVYFTMYLVYAVTLFGPMNLILTGITYTIDMPFTFTIITWIFILAAGSITILISSLVSRAVIAGVIAIFSLLLLTILSNMIVMLIGGSAEVLKYVDISNIASGLLDNYILGYLYWDSLVDSILQLGYTSFFATMMVGRVIDPSIGLPVLLAMVFVPITLACVITEKREIH